MGLFDIFTKKEENKVPIEQTSIPQAVVNTESLAQEIPKEPSMAEQTVLSTNAIIENPQPVLKGQADLKVDLNEVFEGGITKEDEITQIISGQVNQSQTMEEIPPLATDNPFQEAQTKEESKEEIIEIAPTIPGENPFVENDSIPNTISPIPAANQMAEAASIGQESNPLTGNILVETTLNEVPPVPMPNQGVEVPPTTQGDNPSASIQEETTPIAESTPIVPVDNALAENFSTEPNVKEVSLIEEANQIVEDTPTIPGENPFVENTTEAPSPSDMPTLAEPNHIVTPVETPQEEISHAETESSKEILPMIEENKEEDVSLEEITVQLKKEKENSSANPVTKEEEELILPVIMEESPQLVMIDSTGEQNLFEREVEKEAETLELESETDVTEQIQIAQDIMAKEEEKTPIRFCDKCGEIISDYAVVCPNCGEPID